MISHRLIRLVLKHQLILIRLANLSIDVDFGRLLVQRDAHAHPLLRQLYVHGLERLDLGQRDLLLQRLFLL